MKKLFKSTFFNFVLIFGFTALALWLVLKDNYDEVFLTLQHANLFWIALAVAAALCSQAFIGLILTIFARMYKLEYSFKNGFINALIASFFHGITPSASGGQFVQVYVFRKQGIQVSDSASILWMDFIIYQCSMIGLVALLLILRYHAFASQFSNLFILVFFGFLMNSLVIIGLWAVVHFPAVYKWLTTTGVHFAEKIHLIKDKAAVIENLNQQLKRFDSETKRLKAHTSLIIECTLLNLLRLLLYYSIPFFCAKALGIEVSLDRIIDIIALSSFVSMINAFIPIPGASGGTEATFVLLFSFLFGKINAAGCMILWRFVTYYLIMITGGLLFIVFKATIKKDEAKELKGRGL